MHRSGGGAAASRSTIAFRSHNRPKSRLLHDPVREGCTKSCCIQWPCCVVSIVANVHFTFDSDTKARKDSGGMDSTIRRAMYVEALSCQFGSPPKRLFQSVQHALQCPSIVGILPLPMHAPFELVPGYSSSTICESHISFVLLWLPSRLRMMNRVSALSKQVEPLATDFCCTVARRFENPNL